MEGRGAGPRTPSQINILFRDLLIKVRSGVKRHQGRKIAGQSRPLKNKNHLNPLHTQLVLIYCNSQLMHSTRQKRGGFAASVQTGLDYTGKSWGFFFTLSKQPSVSCPQHQSKRSLSFFLQSITCFHASLYFLIIIFGRQHDQTSFSYKERQAQLTGRGLASVLLDQGLLEGSILPHREGHKWTYTALH